MVKVPSEPMPFLPPWCVPDEEPWALPPDRADFVPIVLPRRNAQQYRHALNLLNEASVDPPGGACFHADTEGLEEEE